MYAQLISAPIIPNFSSNIQYSSQNWNRQSSFSDPKCQERKVDQSEVNEESADSKTCPSRRAFIWLRMSKTWAGDFFCFFFSLYYYFHNFSPGGHSSDGGWVTWAGECWFPHKLGQKTTSITASLLIVVRFLDTYHFEVGCSWRSTDCHCTSCSNVQLCNECKIIHMVYSSGLPWVSARVGVALDIYAGSHPRSWPNRGNVTLC